MLYTLILIRHRVYELGKTNALTGFKTDETKKWITEGLTRTFYFEDGTTVHKKLLTVAPNMSFSYEINNFISIALLGKKNRREMDIYKFRQQTNKN